MTPERNQIEEKKPDNKPSDPPQQATTGMDTNTRAFVASAKSRAKLAKAAKLIVGEEPISSSSNSAPTSATTVPPTPTEPLATSTTSTSATTLAVNDVTKAPSAQAFKDAIKALQKWVELSNSDKKHLELNAFYDRVCGLDGSALKKWNSFLESDAEIERVHYERRIEVLQSLGPQFQQWVENEQAWQLLRFPTDFMLF